MLLVHVGPVLFTGTGTVLAFARGDLCPFPGGDRRGSSAAGCTGAPQIAALTGLLEQGYGVYVNATYIKIVLLASQ